MVSGAVANAVINVLNRNGYHWNPEHHVVCDFLAATARAMQELHDQFDRAVALMVSAVLAPGRRVDFLPRGWTNSKIAAIN
jgi:hypothetical protein